MTIYTFGDPELLREALLALATIFSLVEWGDPASAMGLGGNMLAVALVGLLAVAIAGVTSQQVRVDYLLVALVLFGVAFSSRVDVNVEDIQTGDSRVVADIPIGIAVVAAASSSAARSLTETTSLALQRPGATTSVLTDSGFLDPLRTLYALRALTFDSLDSYTYRSLLEWYKMCIGNTLATDPTMFNVKEFRNSADPLTYMLGPPIRYMNFSTVVYSEADPAGTPQACTIAAGIIRAEIDSITVAGSDEALGRIRAERGSKLYNAPFEYADVDDASQIISRGIFDGQQFMQAAAMRNFINVAEAWRLADYGTNEAQYVATLTEAYENKRVQDTSAGTIALQYMFPLMTFFQFLFFTLAPFIALVLIASPFTASKVLGTYFLFGVWAYSWMPIAAVINHYIQITIGNTLEFSDIAATGLQYTALSGMDSLYDQLANKLAIGSMALAATPVIVGAVLTASMSGMTSLAGRFASAGSTNTSISSPRLGEGRALVAAGGMGTVREGLALGSGGSVEIASYQQRTAYGQASVQQSINSGVSQTREASRRAELELGQSRTKLSEAMNSFVQNGVRMQSTSANFTADFQKAFDKAFAGRLSFTDAGSMSASERREASSHLGVDAGFFSMGQRSTSGSGNASALQQILAMDRNETSRAVARFGESFSATETGQQSETGTLATTAREVLKNQEEAERTSAAATRAQTSAQSVNSYTQGGSIELVDLLQSKFASGDDELIYQAMESIVYSRHPRQFGAIQAAQQAKHWNNGEPIVGRDGKSDDRMDPVDKGGTLMLAVADMAASDSSALGTLSELYQYLGRSAGTTVHHGSELLDTAGAHLAQGADIEAKVNERVGDPGKPLNDPAGFTTIQDNAQTARKAGGAPASFTDSNRDTVSAVAEASVARAKAESGFGGMQGEFDQAQAYTQKAFEGGGSVAPNFTDEAVKFWVPGTGTEAGIKTQVGNVLRAAGTDNEQAAIRDALGHLHGVTTTQLGEEFMTFDPRATFKKYTDAGFEPVTALLATYADVGARTPGAGDYMTGALLGAAGYKGAKGVGVPGRLGTATGVVAVGAAIAGAYMVNDQSRENQAQTVELLRGSLQSRFASINSSAAANAEFSAATNNAKNPAELVDVLMGFQQAGYLSGDDVMRMAAPDEMAISKRREDTEFVMQSSAKSQWGD